MSRPRLMTKKGAYGLIDRLNQTPARLRRELKRAAEETARNVMTAARDSAPSGAGRGGGAKLKGGFSAECEENGGVMTAVVRVQNPHAGFVEVGTGRRGAASPSPPKFKGIGGYGGASGMRAQPYLAPAFEKGKEEFTRAASDAVLRAIKGGNG